MPIYEYQCSDCGHHLEILQKIGDAPIEACPQCKKTTMQKLVSAAAFRLKGTGWYETDFKTKGKAKRDEKTQAESKLDKSKPERKSPPGSGTGASAD